MKSILKLCCITLVILPLSAAADWTDAAKQALGGADKEVVADYSDGLLSAVTGGLGVSNDQAEGGLGSLFGLAKDSLGGDDFASLSKLVPGMDGLLAAAPVLGDSGGAVGSLLAGAGDYGSALAGAKTVYDQFAKLGLSTEQIGQYAGIVQGYLESEGGQSAADLFKQGISSLTGG
jgi:hypothetical protein